MLLPLWAQGCRKLFYGGGGGGGLSKNVGYHDWLTTKYFKTALAKMS